MVKCKSQVVISLLETGSESVAQPQPKEQQLQQFEKEENKRVVDAGRDNVKMETRGQEQEEQFQLPSEQQQQLQTPGAPPMFRSHRSYSHSLRLGARAPYSSSRRGSKQQK